MEFPHPGALATIGGGQESGPESDRQKANWSPPKSSRPTTAATTCVTPLKKPHKWQEGERFTRLSAPRLDLQRPVAQSSIAGRQTYGGKTTTVGHALQVLRRYHALDYNYRELC